MVATAFEPLAIPAYVWQQAAVRDALRARDLGRLFGLLRVHGASQGRLATAFGLSQGRISEIARGRRTVTALEVFERYGWMNGRPWAWGWSSPSCSSRSEEAPVSRRGQASDVCFPSQV